MTGHGEKLSRKQDLAISALLSCDKVADAAEQAGVSEKTLYRWMQEPEFKAAYRAARQAVLQASIGALQAASSEGVATLRRNLTCGTPSVEVQAAAKLLDQCFKAAELHDIIERLEEIEAHLRGKEAKGGEAA